ncbi:DUF4369 domain-containing protein [Psychroserpens ponticola]|uniref:DUF4369 domain-containing protein n=1 Tax=Psychroserpens ponticola TaxID=2932268 RepID=A0ABY7RUH1_9FLAO|nr:DUF4369 domain-containing protein [Psychroserpens ponticola]WCO00776.1 DUF4369 domain-containing protein [Psychroserpens ponticola]
MKYILGAVLLSFLMVSCAKEEPHNFKLKGYVKGLKKGTVYLQKQQDSLLITLDSLEIKGDSNFELHTDLEEPEILTLKLDKNDDKENWVSFFADTGVTEIRSTRKLFNFNSVIIGSKQQEVLEEYLSTISILYNRNLDVLESNFNTNSSTTFNEQQQKSLKQKYSYTIQFALNNRNSEVAPYLAVYEIPNTTVRYLDTIYKTLTPPIKASKYGKLLKETIDLRSSEAHN